MQNGEFSWQKCGTEVWPEQFGRLEERRKTTESG